MRTAMKILISLILIFTCPIQVLMIQDKQFLCPKEGHLLVIQEHSVSKTSIYDEFSLSDRHLLLTKTSFSDQGAGMPDHALLVYDKQFVSSPGLELTYPLNLIVYENKIFYNGKPVDVQGHVTVDIKEKLVLTYLLNRLGVL